MRTFVTNISVNFPIETKSRNEKEGKKRKIFIEKETTIEEKIEEV